MCGMAHAQQDIVAGVDSVRDLLLPQRGKALDDDARGRRNPYIAQYPRRKSATEVFRLDAYRKSRPRLGHRQRYIEWRKRQAIDRRRLPRHAVVVHRIDAVGGDVHFVERAADRRRNVEDTFDGDPAQGQVVGKGAVIGGEAGEVGAEPGSENIHGESASQRVGKSATQDSHSTFQLLEQAVQ